MSTEQTEQQKQHITTSSVSLPSAIERQEEGMKQAPSVSVPEQTARDLVMDIAVQVGEDPGKLVQRTDVGTVLERMKEGVVVTLHISRPRFWSRLTLDDLGLAADGRKAMSEEANEIINAYFKLGRRSLLPKAYQDRLASAESSARYCLARYSFKSHWGYFVPLTKYQQWKDDNGRLEAEFWSIRDDILANYDAIVEQVVEDNRPLAEDAWRRLVLGVATQDQEKTLTRTLIREVTERLRLVQGKEAFVTNYLAYVRAAIPVKVEIEDGFEYRIERGVIPLPSLVASDMEQADRIYRDRALQDAETRRQLLVIEAQRQAEMQLLSLQQRQERDEQYRKLQMERERQEMQLQMERDVLTDARRQKERLVREFYTGIVQQINLLVHSVSSNILESLDEHGGILRGPVSTQLRNLVVQLEQLNFVDDGQIENQLARLRDVLPTEEEQRQASKGLARIDTARIGKVVRALNQEAEHILVDLGVQPRVRRRRGQAMEEEQLIALDARRRKTRSESLLGEEAQGVNDVVVPSSRRTRRSL